MTERPLPPAPRQHSQPLGPPSANPLDIAPQRPLPPSSAMPHASDGYLEQIAKMQTLALQELREQRQIQERIFSKLRDLWLLAIAPIILLLLAVLWVFYTGFR